MQHFTAAHGLSDLVRSSTRSPVVGRLHTVDPRAGRGHLRADTRSSTGTWLSILARATKRLDESKATDVLRRMFNKAGRRRAAKVAGGSDQPARRVVTVSIDARRLASS